MKTKPAREEASKRLLARAATVESALGRAISWETAAQAFIHAFEAQLGLSLKRGELSESESKRTDELVKEKYDHPSWTERVSAVEAVIPPLTWSSTKIVLG